MRIGCLELQDDLTPANWIVERIGDGTGLVDSIVPEGFEAYVRVFHPAMRVEGDLAFPVRWADVAAANNRVVHPTMQWPHISGVSPQSGESKSGLWDWEPEEGNLPEPIADILRTLLEGHTSTPDRVWFCIWNGYGGLKVHPDDGTAGGILLLHRPWWLRLLSLVEDRLRSLRRVKPHEPPVPTVRLPGRDYYLLAGPIEGILESFLEEPFTQTANLWWPEDRTWFVATEIDFAWTYVGGSASLIRAVLATPDLEALPVQLSDGITVDSDRINPPPPARP